MAKWEIIQHAKVMKDLETGDLGIQCCGGEEVMCVGNKWHDVTSDFEWDERVIPLSCAVVAGNNVLHFNAEMQLTEEINEEIQFVTTDKWKALIETTVPAMVVRQDGTVAMTTSQDGTVTMYTAYYNAYGYVSMDFTGVSTSDIIYIDMVVPVE